MVGQIHSMCVPASLPVCVHVRVCLCACVHAYVCACLLAYVCACLLAYVCACLLAYVCASSAGKSPLVLEPQVDGRQQTTSALQPDGKLCYYHISGIEYVCQKNVRL